MTVTLPEAGQADAPGPSPRERHLADYLVAMTDADKALRECIAAELAEQVPALEEAEAKAAGVLREACAALEAPEQGIAAVEEEITQAEAELVTWRAQLEQGDVAARVTARTWVTEWETELSALRQKRDYAVAEALPLVAAKTKAKADLDQATAARQGRELNASPALAYYAAGQKTTGYGFRFGMGLRAALCDRDHYEHDAAIEYMLYLCQISGFRTEDYADVLPSDAEQARRYWDWVHEDAMNRAASDPVPTAMDLKMQTTAEMENMALQESAARNVADDRRPARQVPAPPRRSYMEVPSLRDMGLR